ncbi:MAG: hypothetical protein AAGA97_08230 [Pseudomonadota bacterium]
MTMDVTPRQVFAVRGAVIYAFVISFAMQAAAAPWQEAQPKDFDGGNNTFPVTSESQPQATNRFEALIGTFSHDQIDDAPHATAPTTDPYNGVPKSGDIAQNATENCVIGISATPIAAAMVELSIDAPCHTLQNFTIQHENLVFTASTDSFGFADHIVPALEEDAIYAVSFESGGAAIANAFVDTIEFYDRYVVQWIGASGMQLHAMEHGASYGDQGHVWLGSARDYSAAAKGEGGFIVRLGEPGIENAQMAEIYTFPARTSLRGNDVEVRLEAEIDAQNCGKDVIAQVSMQSGKRDMDQQRIVLSVPGCDSVGDFLVLKNFDEDRKLLVN